MRLRKLKNALSIAIVPVVAGLLTIAQAEAATVVGGSTLLGAAEANQLESWLGEGSITLTNIYTKVAGDDSFDFHSAVDGKGRTFAVMLATEDDGRRSVIGGYNPQSWRFFEDFHITFSDADRTAFIFNLTTASLFRQNLSSELTFGSDSGGLQTYNRFDYGPTFGGGHDIYVDATLGGGYSYLWSYSDVGTIGSSIVNGSSYSGPDVRYGAIEVFTISTTAPIPEPETYAMLLAGLGLLGFAARRRKLKNERNS